MEFGSEKIVRLDRVDRPPAKVSDGNQDHPMRKVTRDSAFSSDTWTHSRAEKVAALFDELADTWSEKDFSLRGLPVFDSFARGNVERGNVGLELGSGTGAYSDYISKYYDLLLCVDISQEMLNRSTSRSGLLVRGDGSNLPVKDGSIDSLICINTLFFPREVDRILSPHGCLIWVSTSGAQTPIYLSPDEVSEVLGPRFQGISSEAGDGVWSVFHRISD